MQTVRVLDNAKSHGRMVYRTSVHIFGLGVNGVARRVGVTSGVREWQRSAIRRNSPFKSELRFRVLAKMLP